MSPKRFFTLLIGFTLIGSEFLQISSQTYLEKVAKARAELALEHTESTLLLTNETSDPALLKQSLKSLQTNYDLTRVESLSADNSTISLTFAASEDLAFIIAAQETKLQLEPDYILSALTAPLDQHYPEQWYLHNTGQSYHASSSVQTQGTTGIDINWQNTFEYSSIRGTGVTVAVIDSGLTISHPELANNLWVNSSETADGLDNDGNGLVDDINGWNYLNNNNVFTDELGHGTQAAGLIAAQNNSLGITGVAPGSKVMTLKVLDNNGSGRSSDVIKAINYAVNKGAKVINMSFGGAGADSIAMINTCNNAVNNGVVVVAAAGNGNQDIGLTHFAPANIPSVIAVGSISNTGSKASFSNTGNALSLVTPGIQLLTTRSGGSGENSAQVLADGSNNFIITSGTSFSSPIVAGAAALVIAQNPAFTVAQVRNQLEQTARDLGTAGKDTQFGYGLLDISHALNITAPTNTAPIILNSSWSTNPVNISQNATTTLTITATDTDSDALSVQADFTTLGLSTQTLSSSSNNTYISNILSPLVNSGNYTVPFSVSDPTHTATGSIILSITETPAQIAITSPTTESTYSTEASGITLSGTIQGNVHSLTINGTLITTFTANQSVWSSSVTLPLGTTSYLLQAFNSSNQQVSSDTITITRTESVLPITDILPPETTSPSTPTYPTTDPSPEVTTPPAPTPTETTTRRRRDRNRDRDEDPIVTAQQTISFADVPATHFATNQIRDLAQKAAINGINNFFFPYRTISRGEFLKVAMRDAGLINSTCSQNQAHFSDTNSTFNSEIHCAVYQRIVEDNTNAFYPYAPITREQAILWLVAIRRLQPQVATRTFPDVTDIRIIPYIEIARLHSWIQGVNGLFYPKSFLSRGEAAKIIVNSRH